MNAYLEGMRRSFDFAGRSGRGAYWLFTLTYFVILCALTLIDGAIGTLSDDGIGALGAIAILVHLIPTISVTVRRLHDIGRSGWWILIGFVPLIGIITLIVFACMPTQPGSNRFGNQPHANPTTPATAPATVPHASPATTHLDQIEKLSALRTSGAIDDDEFKAMKAKLLAEHIHSDR